MEGERILNGFLSWAGLNTWAIQTRLWTEYCVIQHAILLKIAAIIADHKAGIAVPMRALHLHQEPGCTPVLVPTVPGTL